MITVLLGTNIILDVVLKREPFFQSSSRLFPEIGQGNLSAFISATTITDLYYIGAKQISKQKISSFLIDMLDLIEVEGADSEIIRSATHSDFRDFEDAVHISSEVDFIVTRNQKDFENKMIRVLAPEEVIKKISQ